MQYTTETVAIDNVIDAYSLVSISDVYETLQKYLDTAELQKYSMSCLNIMMGAKLSRSETILLNKVDEITMREHGMCLKDSAVTKARLKACRRFGMKFIDRDGLVDHMKMMLAL
jgi:hypothetical protein